VWESLGYGSSMAVGQGRLVGSTSGEGLYDIYRAPAGTTIGRWADQERGRKAYEDRGLHLTHGPGGWGYYGLDLPWDVHPDVDGHLVRNGHKRPA
jgi:hypothetical protein